MTPGFPRSDHSGPGGVGAIERALDKIITLAFGLLSLGILAARSARRRDRPRAAGRSGPERRPEAIANRRPR